jgi:hypothetical protein
MYDAGHSFEQCPQFASSAAACVLFKRSSARIHDSDDRTDKILTESESACHRQQRDDVHSCPAPKQVADYRDCARKQCRRSGNRPDNIGASTVTRKAQDTASTEPERHESEETSFSLTGAQADQPWCSFDRHTTPFLTMRSSLL